MPIDFSGDVPEAIQFRQRLIEFTDQRHTLMSATLVVSRAGFTNIEVTLSFKLDDYLRLLGSEDQRAEAVRQNLAEKLTKDWRNMTLLLVDEDERVKLLETSN